ncbi:MAG: TIR domain-containing protein [Chlorobiales bacterium]|nr:TIR domain-containing protein [Chlorobiales bacterium]
MLSNAYLRRAIISEANFQDANLSNADLIGTYLIGANFIEANLFQASLSFATIRNTNLMGANLIGADLKATDFSNGELIHANLSGAEAGHTIFANVDLSETKGLENVKHYAPSEISISTLYKSKGKIPDAFLRGCGVPDNFIEYVHSLTNQPFDYYSCFISHSTRDKAFVDRLHADLQASGVRCWYSEHDMQGGKKVHEQIDQAIRIHEKLLLVLSENSMESEWVKAEIRKAKKREDKEGKRVLFPISLSPFKRIQEWEFFDSDRGKDLAAEIREFYIPCFAGWEQNHELYKKEFDKLLRDMKSEGE